MLTKIYFCWILYEIHLFLSDPQNYGSGMNTTVLLDTDLKFQFPKASSAPGSYVPSSGLLSRLRPYHQVPFLLLQRKFRKKKTGVPASGSSCRSSQPPRKSCSRQKTSPAESNIFMKSFYLQELRKTLHRYVLQHVYGWHSSSFRKQVTERRDHASCDNEILSFFFRFFRKHLSHLWGNSLTHFSLSSTCK